MEDMPASAAPLPSVAAGFPVRAPRDVDVPGFTTVLGRGILSGALGADFECEGSLLPGKCALARPIDAARLCAGLPDCLSVVVCLNGRPVELPAGE